MTIRDKRFWLWRAVDQQGVVVKGILQPRRDKWAAMRRLIKRKGRVAKAIVPDKLGSFEAAQHVVASDLLRKRDPVKLLCVRAK